MRTMPPETFLYRLWAKTNERDDGATPQTWARHPLPCHLLDVGLVAEAWLDADEPLLDRFCRLWIGDTWTETQRESVRRALVLAASLHDTGKIDRRFQDNSERGWAEGFGHDGTPRPSDWHGAYDHGEGTGAIFSALTGGRYSIPGADPRWTPFAELFRVAAGHHGTLYPEIVAESRMSRDAAYRERALALIGEVTRVLGEPPDGLPPPSNPALMLAAGFVSIADWFGSDTAFFPPAPHVASREQADEYVARLRRDRNAERALGASGLLVRTRPDKSFSDLFAPDGETWTLDGFQEAACDVPFGTAPGAEIAVVEAPMGLGKTEIALWLAARALAAGHANGLYLALPTQATSNAMFARIEQFASRIVGPDDLSVALAHGARRYAEDYEALAEKGRRRPFTRPASTDGLEEASGEVVATAWMQSAKRSLLAPLGVGTVDQAMLGAMTVRHGFVRLFGLAGKVVVIDEVHAYDVYMGVILGHLLRWLRALGAKVILMSATLPPSLRRKLLADFGVTEAPAATDYPMLLHARPGECPEPTFDPRPDTKRAEERTSVRVQPIEASHHERTARGAAWVGSALEHGGVVAWMRNTVREAQDAARALREAGHTVDLLHARFALHDRNRNERDLLGRYGRDGDRPGAPRVVVGTQVLEQSLDVDFDAMLTDLAPVDLMLQRAGRLWRHARPDAARHGHAGRVLGVLMPTERERRALSFGTSAYVYDAETLGRSAALLLKGHAGDDGARTWTLPDDCASLVAELYDGDWDNSRIGCDVDALVIAQDRFSCEQHDMKRKAGEALVTRPERPPATRTAARDDETDGGIGIGTRYGDRGIALVLFRDGPGGPVPVGADATLCVPEDTFPARLAAEKAVALATVPVPWRGRRPDDKTPPSTLAPLARWWRDTHPYDHRLFARLTPDPTRDEPDREAFALDAFEGTYSPTVGLTLTRRPVNPLPAVPDPDAL